MIGLDKIGDPEKKKTAEKEFLVLSEGHSRPFCLTVDLHCFCGFHKTAYGIVGDDSMRRKYDELVEYGVFEWDEKRYNMMRMEKEEKFHKSTGFRHFSSFAEDEDTTVPFFAAVFTVSCIVAGSIYFWHGE